MAPSLPAGVKDIIRTLVISIVSAFLISSMVGVDLGREKRHFFNELDAKNDDLKSDLMQAMQTIKELNQKLTACSVAAERSKRSETPSTCKCDTSDLQTHVSAMLAKAEALTLPASGSQAKKPVTDCPPPSTSHSVAKDHLRQQVFEVRKNEGLPIVGDNHGMQWRYAGGAGKIHLLGTQRDSPPDEFGQLKCTEIDLVFHNMQRGRCVMLIPDTYIQSGLVTVAMEKNSSGQQQPAPLVEHERNTASSETSFIRDQRLISFFQGRKQMIEEVRALVGMEDKTTREQLKNSPAALLVMCANEGHMPLLINWACSLKHQNIPMPKHLIFAISAELEATITKLGFTCYYSPLMGTYDQRSSVQFGDGIFGQMMILKQLSVHLALDTGFDVLFQDVDVTWLTDPTSDLLNQSRFFDVLFQDDGSRSTTFEPYYGNSGFFYIRNSYEAVRFWDLVTLAMPGLPRSNQKVIAPFLELFARQHDSKQLIDKPFKVKVLSDQVYLAGHKITHPLGLKKPTDTLKEIPESAKILHFCWTNHLDDKIHKLKAYNQMFVSEACLRNFSVCHTEATVGGTLGYDEWSARVCNL
eukprot:m.11158 g.11158  ORF g.11158 m.11158 type:complete len:582 (-) comp8687_c0_seq1:212-1957(-)